MLLNPDDLSVIYKIHGGVDPVGKWHTSVMTEEDYFEIGGRIYDTSLLPIQVRLKLESSSILSLGYRLSDMHVRYLITATRRWASAGRHFLVSKSISRLDRWKFKRLGVHTYDLSVEEFVEGLQCTATC